MNMTHDRLHVVCGLCNNVDVHVMCKHPSFVQLYIVTHQLQNLMRYVHKLEKASYTFTFLRQERTLCIGFIIAELEKVCTQF